MVRFVVEDYDSASDNEFVGQYTLPFSSLQMGELSLTHSLTHSQNSEMSRAEMSLFLAGYRHVPLLDQNGDLLPSSGLFVHIMVVDA